MSVILALKVISKLAVSAFVYVLYTCLHVHLSRIVKKTPPNFSEIVVEVGIVGEVSRRCNNR